jgi:hypothetical protein
LESKLKLAPIDCQGGNDWEAVQNSKYVRALLGLAETNEYLTEHRDIKYIINIKAAANNPEITRMQSSILVKVFGNSIYFLPNKLEPEILAKKFNFFLRKKYKNRLDDTIIFDKVKIPNGKEEKKERPIVRDLQVPNEFDVADFLDFALNNSRNREAIKDYIKLSTHA